ncbi:unnamed protein product [Anisakis simplex]|uniref:SEFIR domain-containing protein n=1 Tax=Anisakis simplex TaxID=6269 RepID=A0A0M3K3Y5_ANISI|nr:unnamed protein product [Anisakis simplex]
MLAALVYARLQRSSAQRVERDIMLTQRPTVLIVYTDDCLAHSNCILAFAKLLEDVANARVHIDQLELNTSGAIPTRWFIDTFAKCQFVIVVFSEGSEMVLKGETMICERPFPDLFDTAINHIISELNRTVVSSRHSSSTRSLSERFIFVHMSYSPSSVIPPNIAAFPVRILSIPSQIGELIARLHEQPIGSQVVHHVESDRLETAIEEVLTFRRVNPSWLEDRLVKQNNNKDEIRKSEDVKLLPISKPHSLPTFAEQIRLARKLNIEPPDEEQEGERTGARNQESGIGNNDDLDAARFALIGSPDDLSDSD